MKTSELTGAALDWAVAKCEYDNRRYNYGSPCFSPETKRVYETQGLQEIGVSFSPSTDWKQGGPIIEREMIQLTPHCMVNPLYGWAAAYRSFDEDDDVYALFRKRGKTPLIAAMRCYVASKLGAEIEIPKELL
jgi:hypothetical protein